MPNVFKNGKIGDDEINQFMLDIFSKNEFDSQNNCMCFETK